MFLNFIIPVSGANSATAESLISIDIDTDGAPFPPPLDSSPPGASAQINSLLLIVKYLPFCPS